MTTLVIRNVAEETARILAHQAVDCGISRESWARAILEKEARRPSVGVTAKLETLLRMVVFAQEAMPETLYAAFDERDVVETITWAQEMLSAEGEPR